MKNIKVHQNILCIKKCDNLPQSGIYEKCPSPEMYSQLIPFKLKSQSYLHTVKVLLTV